MYADLVLCRVGCSNADSSKRTKSIGVQGLTASVHQGIVGAFGVCSACRRVRRVVASGVAVAIGVGHAAGESGGGFAVRAGGGVSPSAVTAGVFGHLSSHADCGKGRVVVGVEAIFFNLLPSLFLVVLASLAFPPQDDTSQD